MAEPQEPLALDSLERNLLGTQIEFFLKAAPDPAAYQAYAELAAAVAAQSVPAQLIPPLEAILEVCLTGDRLRRTAGPPAQLALAALFQKTPRGKARAAELEALNQALSQLKGQSLLEISAAARGPGAYALTLGTQACRMVIRLEASGARVESLEVG